MGVHVVIALCFLFTLYTVSCDQLDEQCAKLAKVQKYAHSLKIVNGKLVGECVGGAVCTTNRVYKTSLNCSQYINIQRHRRVVNGSEALPHSFPWMVHLEDNINGTIRCGASLLNDRFLLTAAHCVYVELQTIVELLFVGKHCPLTVEFYWGDMIL